MWGLQNPLRSMFCLFRPKYSIDLTFKHVCVNGVFKQSCFYRQLLSFVCSRVSLYLCIKHTFFSVKLKFINVYILLVLVVPGTHYKYFYISLMISSLTISRHQPPHPPSHRPRPRPNRHRGHRGHLPPRGRRACIGRRTLYLLCHATVQWRSQAVALECALEGR